jgi:hypothetical protein
MKIIELYFNKFKIGELSCENKKYAFVSDEQANNLLLKKDSTFLNAESTNAVKKFDSVPALFEKFLPKSEEAVKSMEAIGIHKTDSDFDKLLKISKLDLTKDAFWIKTVEK